MQITRLLLDRVARRMRAQGVELEVSDEAVEYLANAGFDPQYGARPLRRAIQRLLEDDLSERLLAGEIEPGQPVRVDLRDGRLNVETVLEAEAVGAASETGTRS
jgi:ATP-dependent Clp protease ATP-binding subunit ClpC